MDRFIKSGKIKIGIILGIFTLMLVCNIFTPMLVDDFAYSYSFATGERITGFSEIFPSLAAHAKFMNGRLVAHFFAQLFLLLPGIVFDFVNALMFTLMIFLIYRIAKGRGRENNLLLLFIFLFVWVVQPDFGQVYLWLDGSCNYLFSIVFSLLYITPFVDYVLYDRRFHPLLTVVFIPVAFAGGAYMENISPVIILMSALLVLGGAVFLKKSIRIWHIVLGLSSFAGFLFMMCCPAEWSNKSSDFSLISVLKTTLVSFGIVFILTVPIVIYVLLLRKAKKQGVDKAAIITSAVFVIGAAVSNFIMLVASYYPLRCSVGACTFMIVATALLFARVKIDSEKILRRALTVTLFVSSVAILTGVADIGYTYAQVRENEEFITESVDGGTLDVEVPYIRVYTKYSAAFGLKYLSTETSQDWPNIDMAKYLGAKSIIGKRG